MDTRLDDLKKQWKGLSSASVVLNSGNADEYRPTSRILSRSKKLQRYYKIISVLAAVWVVLGPLMLYPQGLLHVWGCVLLSAFFALMGAFSFDLYLKIKRLDFANMNTCQLLVSVERIYRRFIITTFIGIALCVPMLAVMLQAFSSHGSALLGGVVGAIVGGYIGWRKNKTVRVYLKEIRQELMSVSEA